MVVVVMEDADTVPNTIAGKRDTSSRRTGDITECGGYIQPTTSDTLPLQTSHALNGVEDRSLQGPNAHQLGSD